MTEEMRDLRVVKGHQTRTRLLAAARELFGRRGYDDTSIELILQAAGVQRGGFYHHFGSKQAAFDAVLDTVIAELAVEVASATPRDADPRTVLRVGCAAWLRLLLDPSVQRITLLDPPSVLGWKRWREIDEQHILVNLRRTLKRLPSKTTCPAEEIDLLAHLLLAAVGEAALHIASSDAPHAALAAADSAVGRLIDSMVDK
ncbi:helix-turn-helix domain-containing protein [Micromonospora sp. NPDC005324]|uniref:TetR/AcrR family transcriptional regulator n=1 Tax=Micromonospora sp. NPDC005324 TaxID=3157033 RepID=UPI0033B96876